MTHSRPVVIKAAQPQQASALVSSPSTEKADQSFRTIPEKVGRLFFSNTSSVLKQTFELPPPWFSDEAVLLCTDELIGGWEWAVPCQGNTCMHAMARDTGVSNREPLLTQPEETNTLQKEDLPHLASSSARPFKRQSVLGDRLCMSFG